MKFGLSHILAAAAALVLLAPGPVAAQTTANAAADGASAAPAQSTQPAVRSGLGPSPEWNLVGGFEADTHGTGYTFFGPSYERPISDNLAWTARVYGNYLFYEFEENGGTTRVRSPGVSTAVGLKIGGDNWMKVGVGVGVKRRTEEFTAANGAVFEDTSLDPGINLGVDAYLNPTDLSNVHGMFSYSAEDGYIWSRLGAKRQLTNYEWRNTFTHYVGAEFMGQGNDDFRALQVGAFVEFTHVPSSASIMLRGGYKQSTFDVGPDKTGPYFAIGYYQSLR